MTFRRSRKSKKDIGEEPYGIRGTLTAPGLLACQNPFLQIRKGSIQIYESKGLIRERIMNQTADYNDELLLYSISPRGTVTEILLG